MTTQHRRSLLFLILLIVMSGLMFWSGYRIGKVDGEREIFKKTEQRLEERSNSNQTISMASHSICFYLVSLQGEKEVLLTLLESALLWDHEYWFKNDYISITCIIDISSMKITRWSNMELLKIRVWH